MRQLPAPRSSVPILITGEISGRSLARELADRGERPDATSVVIIAPAPLQAATAWADDIDAGIALAERKVDDLVALLRNQGYTAVGKVGDSNPVRAIEDGLAEFPSKGVIVATHQGRRMKLLARYLIDLLTRESTGVTRVVMSPIRERPPVRPGMNYPPSLTRKSPPQADDRHAATTQHR
jgi:hypothetical protein